MLTDIAVDPAGNVWAMNNWQDIDSCIGTPRRGASTPELKAAFEQGLEDILSARGGDRNEAIFQTAAKIGAIVLARAVRERLSDEILRSVR